MKKKGQIIISLLNILLVAAAVVILTEYRQAALSGDMSLFLPAFVVMILEIYAAILVELCIHETGHLIFGLLSGYRFISFRLGNFLLLKQDRRLHLRRLRLAGTSGQCLMEPPEGKLPFFLFNMGGVLMNLLSAALFFCLSFLLPGSPFAWELMRLLAAAGLVQALQNGLPLQTSMASNDGRNTLELCRSAGVAEAFRIQLRVAAAQARGMTLGQMPESWFYLPDPEVMKSSLGATVAFMACGREMQREHFSEAEDMMELLFREETGLAGIHRTMLNCDRVFCRLLDGRTEQALALLDEEQRKNMKAMGRSLQVLRTEYAMALLAERNPDKAEKLEKQFTLMEKVYPYPASAACERRLLELARSLF